MPLPKTKIQWSVRKTDGRDLFNAPVQWKNQNSIQIFFGSLNSWTSHFESECKRWLTDAELREIDALDLKIRKQQKWISTALLRSQISRGLLIPSEQVQFQKTPNGKLIFEGMSFSITHSDEYWAIVLSKDFIVGIDLEASFSWSKERCLRVARRHFAKPEQMALEGRDERSCRHLFFSYWTCKEAAIKCLGLKIANQLKVLEVKEQGPWSVGSCRVFGNEQIGGGLEFAPFILRVATSV